METRSTAMEKMRNLFVRKTRKRSGTKDKEIAGDYDNDDGDEDNKGNVSMKSVSTIMQSQRISENGTSIIPLDMPKMPSTESCSGIDLISLNNVTKKKSSFQITSVVKSSKSCDVDDFYESADDLDQTVSGDTYDALSDDATDDDDEIDVLVPESSLISNHLRQQPSSTSSIVPLSNASLAFSTSLNALPVRPSSLPVSQSFNTISSKASSAHSSALKVPLNMLPSSLVPYSRSRFRIVKLRSAQPFSTGRWTCLDYIDSPSSSLLFSASPSVCVTPTKAYSNACSNELNIPTSDIGSSTHSISCIDDSMTKSAMLRDQISNFASGLSSQSANNHSNGTADIYSPVTLHRSVSMQNVRNFKITAVNPHLPRVVSQTIVPASGRFVTERLSKVMEGIPVTDYPFEINSSTISFPINHSNLYPNMPAEMFMKPNQLPSGNESFSTNSTAVDSRTTLLGPEFCVAKMPVANSFNDVHSQCTESDLNQQELHRSYLDDATVKTLDERGLSAVGTLRIAKNVSDLVEANGRNVDAKLKDDSESRIDSTGGSGGDGHVESSGVRRALFSSPSLSKLCEEEDEIDCDGEDDDEFSRISNKITEALELVKHHVIYTVNEEMMQLHSIIQELTMKNHQLMEENYILRSNVSAATLARLHTVLAHQASTTTNASTYTGAVASNLQH